MTNAIDRLPAEILLKILQLASEPHFNNDFTLVCKTWLNLARTVQFSKICIVSLPHLEKFYDLIQRRPDLGTKVKKIEAKCQTEGWWEFEKIYDLFSKLLSGGLPNLEEINPEGLCLYSHIRNALLGSHLKYLKELHINEFWRCDTNIRDNRIADYVECVLLSKRSIKKIEVNDNWVTWKESFDHENSRMAELYRSLHQFNDLTDLTLTTNTSNEIKDLENIAATCKSLKSLRIVFSDGALLGGHITSLSKIVAFTPSYSIRNLNLQCSSLKTVSCIEHIFPKLRSLVLKVNDAISNRMDQQTLNRLLKFGSKLDEFGAFRLFPDERAVPELINDYLNATSNAASARVEITQSMKLSDRDPFTFGIYKPDRASGATIWLSYPAGDARDYATFFERNGEYISELELSFESGLDPLYGKVNSHFIANVFSHCRNLKKLRFNHCNLEFATSIDNCNAISTFEALVLDDCIIADGVMEQLSLLLPHIDVMSWSRKFDFPGPAPFKMMMPNSKIGILIMYFERARVGEVLRCFIKLHSVDDEKTAYHSYLRTDNFRKPPVIALSTEDDYTNADRNTHINICTQTRVDLFLETIPVQD